jgi:hypothetical protein
MHQQLQSAPQLQYRKWWQQAQKVNWMLWFHKTKSVTAVQRKEYGLNPPTTLSICPWYKQFSTHLFLKWLWPEYDIPVQPMIIDKMYQPGTCYSLADKLSGSICDWSTREMAWQVPRSNSSQCLNISMNSKFVFEMLVYQLTCKCCPVFGKRLSFWRV